MANHKNLASVVLENGGTTSQSSIVMSDADAAVFPSAPFYATIMPSGELANNTNSEIIEVTSSSTLSGNTTFIISRAQRGTSAISWSAGEAIMVNGIYVEDAIFEGATLSTPSNVAYVAEANIQSNAVTTSKIADGSVTSDKIDYTTFVDSTTERIVGKDINNNSIYERTFTGTVNFTANSRVWVIRVSGVKRILSVEGWIELPVDNDNLKWTTSIGQGYRTSSNLSSASADSWCYVDSLGNLTVSAFGAAASNGNVYYVKCRYTKPNV